jgi:hypothetical protein
VNFVTIFKSNIKHFSTDNLTFTLLKLADKITTKNQKQMNNIFKGLIAGYGANKLGGGCFGTIIVFVIIWFLLGQCS